MAHIDNHIEANVARKTITCRLCRKKAYEWGLDHSQFAAAVVAFKEACHTCPNKPNPAIN